MKFIAIDSLPRSGTTLLASLLGSQKGIAASTGVLNEPLAYHQGDWPMSYLEKDVINPDFFSPEPVMDIHQFKKTELKTIEDDFNRRSAGLNIDEWKLIFDNIKSYDDLDKAYLEFCQLKNADQAVVLRWNNMLYYSRVWTSRPDHYWISIIRDPRDRAVSRYSTFLETSLEAIVHETFHYFNQLHSFETHKNFFLVFYEDLVRQPGSVIKQIGDFVGLPLENANLTDIVSAGHNKKYRNEGWRAKSLYGDHKIGTEFKGVHDKSVGQWKRSAMVYKENLIPWYHGLEEIINNFEVLHRYKDV